MKLYDVLGVTPDATQTEIRQAYRKLAMELHPDRPNGDAEAFLPVQAAYDVLGDKKKRALYDETGDIEDRHFEDLVVDRMMQLFNGMLTEENEVTGDAVEQMMEMIHTGIRGTIINKEKLEQKNLKLLKRKNRIKIRQGKGANLYRQLADAAIASCNQSIARLDEELDVLDEVLNRMEFYEDVEPVIQTDLNEALQYFKIRTTSSTMP